MLRGGVHVFACLRVVSRVYSLEVVILVSLRKNGVFERGAKSIFLFLAASRRGSHAGGNKVYKG